MKYLHTPPDWKPTWCKLSNGWWFLPINCNGSTAVREHRISAFLPEPVGTCTVAVIRNPIDRLYNVWTSPEWQQRWPDLERLVNHICTYPDLEAHIRPQYRSVEHLMPRLLIDFDNIKAGFDSITPPLGYEPLELDWKPHIRAQYREVKGGPDDPFTDDMLDRIQDIYQQDFELWADL